MFTTDRDTIVVQGYIVALPTPNGEAALERNAVDVRHFLPTLITGLLQTPEYVRAAVAPPIERARGDVGTAIAAKLQRQAVLHEDGKHFRFLLTESALRWQLCPPQVMALQLDRLVSLSRLPTVAIGVLPLDRMVPDGASQAAMLAANSVPGRSSPP